MKLYIAPRAPNPRRVQMFMHEKGMPAIEQIAVDINAGEHRGEAFHAINPVSRLPTLELDDRRFLSETRAICTYLEGLYPEPNLMGDGFEERAFIEMHDRRVEWYWLLPIANAIRHTHPGLAPLEQPQFPDFGQSQALKVRDSAHWLDQHLQQHDWIAGERFTIADITAFCAHEFARGLLKFQAGQEGFHALQAWRERMMERESAHLK